jgi:hypothetical protein
LEIQIEKEFRKGNEIKGNSCTWADTPVPWPSSLTLRDPSPNYPVGPTNPAGLPATRCRVGPDPQRLTLHTARAHTRNGFFPRWQVGPCCRVVPIDEQEHFWSSRGISHLQPGLPDLCALRVEMAKRAGPARPGPGPVKPGQNRAGPAEPAGLSFCPSPARSGPKRAGPARLARKNGPKSGLNGPVSTF